MQASRSIGSPSPQGWVSRGSSASPWGSCWALCSWRPRPQPLSSLLDAARRSHRSLSATPTRSTCPSPPWSRWRLTPSPFVVMGLHSWPQRRSRNRILSSGTTFACRRHRRTVSWQAACGTSWPGWRSWRRRWLRSRSGAVPSAAAWEQLVSTLPGIHSTNTEWAPSGVLPGSWAPCLSLWVFSKGDVITGTSSRGYLQAWAGRDQQLLKWAWTLGSVLSEENTSGRSFICGSNLSFAL